MYQHRFLAVLVLVALVVILGIAQVNSETATPAKPVAANWRALQIQERRVTQAQREAASAARKSQASNQGAKPAGAKLTIEPTPGGIPDYFGVANWAYTPIIRKFVDQLPGLTEANKNNLGQYISVAVPDTKTYPGSDYYELHVQQFAQKLHTDIPATTLRCYVQVNKGTDASGNNTVAPAPIRYLGPLIVAQKNRPVRIKFTNKLPIGDAGKLFVPVDTTVMGAGVGPTEVGGVRQSFTDNRAVIHLHGARTPWISDGTPHQWITPAGESTVYPEGVSKQNVPDMPDPGAGSQTYYYTNQQSSRLLFYHDHAWGITRLNVYVGEAAGYLIRDDAENQLISAGLIPSQEIPLIIQDKSFVDPATVRVTDPTWNWGTGAVDSAGVRAPKAGDLWYPHVYVPAQNPYDLSGANPYGRWHYGPWFYPPTTGIPYLPVPNPYYDPINAPWEPPEMPGVPSVSMPGESYFDTPMVNGCAYPTVTLQPKAYRFRILNAANDRFFNLQLYKADPAVISSDGRPNTEVKMVPASSTPGITGFPGFPNWPTDAREGGVPDPATAGPSFVQIGTEAGFLPAPVVVENQPISWNLNPTTFNFGNVNGHALLVASAERADVVVDFSAYAGQTLILYNDAPAAFPALDPRYDYYTGAPDLTEEGGTVSPMAGFGPNTRTIMQINVAAATPAPAFNLTALENAFKTTPTQDGVFKRSQDPIIVAQAPYNSAYSQTFPTAWPLWGYARIQDTSMKFRTVTGTDVTMEFQPKAIHDEMGAAFDDYGRMAGRLGLELKNPTAFTANFILQNYVDPATEIANDVVSTGPVMARDGTQIWKISHNGVDTHPIHFHLFDVQLLNRVTWDGQIWPPDPNELGWKETVRISPLEDTIVALRPVSPKQPFGIPDSIRPLNPSEPLGSMMGFSNFDPLTGNALPMPTVNEMTNFGWEYVWHCHILSHEEMDMMRPIKFNVARALAARPVLKVSKSGSLDYRLDWTDGTPVGASATMGNPTGEIGFRIERSSSGFSGPFTAMVMAPANSVTFLDTTGAGRALYYRVVAFNAAGDSVSNVVLIGVESPVDPSNLTVTPDGTDVVLAWEDNSADETRFTIQRATVSNFSGYTTFTVGANVTTYTDAAPNRDYYYRVRATNAAGASVWSNTGLILADPTIQSATASVAPPMAITLTWIDESALESGFTIQRSVSPTFANFRTVTAPAAAGAGSTVNFVDRTALSQNTPYYYRVQATNATAVSRWSNTAALTTPGRPASPTALTFVSATTASISMSWTDNASNEAGFYVQRATAGATGPWTNITLPAGLPADTAVYTATRLTTKRNYWFRVWAFNGYGASTYSNVLAVTTN